VDVVLEKIGVAVLVLATVAVVLAAFSAGINPFITGFLEGLGVSN
jgi:hypothetical protein